MSGLYTAVAAVSLGAYSANEQRKAGKKQERALREQGEQAEIAGEFTALQYEAKAGEELAIGQMKAREKQREGEYIKSKAKAIGAASGAGGYDMADLEAQAEYLVLSELYNSKRTAKDYDTAADVARREGADAARASISAASAARTTTQAQTAQNVANIGFQAVSLYNRYGG